MWLFIALSLIIIVNIILPCYQLVLIYIFFSPHIAAAAPYPVGHNTYDDAYAVNQVRTTLLIIFYFAFVYEVCII